jgi:ATP-dependent 26S proteasome regulatory subunit
MLSWRSSRETCRFFATTRRTASRHFCLSNRSQRQQLNYTFQTSPPNMDGSGDPERQKALDDYKTKLLESREWEAKLKGLRMDIKGLQHEFETTEDNIKALQSVGQIIGEVLKQLDDERFIVKASSGPRYVVGCRSKVDKLKLKQGTRVALVSKRRRFEYLCSH